jgi:hypothetical protein
MDDEHAQRLHTERHGDWEFGIFQTDDGGLRGRAVRVENESLS